MTNSVDNYTDQFLSGAGELAALTREKDWSKTSLGSTETWPQSLRTIVGIILNSKFPMFLWWGPDLICFYNDAYRPSLGQNGKHPSILGMTAKEAWIEIWEIIKPLIDQVLGGGGATWSEDQLIPIYRNGKLEDVYWTFSYSPVNDDSGKITGVLVTCFETTEKIKLLRNLEESNSQLAFTIEAAELGTFDLDPVTNMFSANQRLKDWFGLPAQESMELNRALDAIAEKDRNNVSAAIKKAMDYSSGGKYQIQFSIVPPISKKEIVLSAKGQVFFSEDKVAYRLNGTLQDITEQKQFQQQLEKQVNDRTKKLAQNNLDLAKMNKELQSFAYISSHDLQEPLRKIQTFATRIAEKEKDNLSEKGKDLFERMRASAERMQALIDDLLAYSRTHGLERDFKNIDLNVIIVKVIDDLKEEIQQKHASIHKPEICDATVIPFQFQQLFYNLISNCLKFSNPLHDLHISISGERVKGTKFKNENLLSDHEYCHITVADNGIGFEPEYNEKIFELFERLHGNNEYEGTGVGLSIVKRIVENHNGIITAKGEPGKGATFEIYLPIIPETGFSEDKGRGLMDNTRATESSQQALLH
jgi:signal transduction histidine kinase